MNRLIDYAERSLVILLTIPFLIAFGRSLSVHPQYVLLAASEVIGIYFLLTRKPGNMPHKPYAFAIAFLGTSAPLLIRPTGGVALVSEWLSTGLMFAGILTSLAAKLFLNRSFGIVAANRGIKRGGPYRFVRHPMYLGYIVTQVGFLLTSLTPLNLALYCAAWSVQWLRIVEEEGLLMADPAYRDFARSTRWRLLPGVF